MSEPTICTVYINNPPLPYGEHTTAILLSGWHVVNAPRPIPGRVQWQGDYRHGIFYAAGPLAEFGESWRGLDARPVVAITNMEVTQRIAAMALERGTSLSEVLEDFNGDMRSLAAACDLPWAASKGGAK